MLLKHSILILLRAYHHQVGIVILRLASPLYHINFHNCSHSKHVNDNQKVYQITQEFLIIKII